MNIIEYKKIVDKHTKKDKKDRNYVKAFMSGGLLGFISQLIFIIFTSVFKFSEHSVSSYISLSIIGIASFLTALGIFDKIILKARSGLIIPTTGFAHSVTSSAIDYKKEGFINGIGSNVFHLAGSVILYSIVASFILAIVRMVILA
ncbi:MAG: SpoVA/SpoVAEb family sporulation membrane protein [Bacilli bacterium]|nr:SpoVA/SpoVAEb family sporulation membrane protein [Bacilli bacterium]